MDIVLVPLLYVISYIITFSIWIVFSDVIISWLLIANILPMENRIIYALIDSIRRFADFLLDPLRRRLPFIYGIDLSPIAFMLFGIFLNHMIIRILLRF